MTTPRLSTSGHHKLETLKKDAKRWLKALRAGDARARARLSRAWPDAPATLTLRDVQHALALEHGLSGWTALKTRLARPAEIGPIQTDDLRSERPYPPFGSRGCDVWAAIEAARTGDAGALRRLVTEDPRLLKYHEPLRFAGREGHLDAVRVLLDAGADPSNIGYGPESIVTLARERGHDEVADVIEAALLHSARTRPAEQTLNEDAHAAAAANDVETLRRLLDADPQLVHRGDRKGGTPLHRAVMASALAAIELLLERGADIHALHGAGPGDDEGYAAADYQAIDLAIFWRNRGDTETAGLLLARGAAHDLTIAAGLGEIDVVRRLLDEDPASLRSARPSEKRPLSAAVDFGHEAIVRMLLDRGADPNWSEGPSAPLGSALHSAAWKGNRTFVELLLDHGADPNSYVDSSGNATWAAKTPELRALLYARGGKLDCYDLIWLHDDEEVVRRITADPASGDAGCGGVFAAAATLGKRDLVVRMLAAGARVPPIASGCRSYLMEDPEILKLLLAGGMNPDLPDWHRATPLHDLCGRDTRGRAQPRRVESAIVLLDAGADINARDEDYRSTPLAWAARNGLVDMVELLLSRGAPTNLPDDEPWATPLAWATKRGHPAIVDRLRAAGASS